MRITWLSTNINMRWRWSLAQQGMTVSSLLVSAPAVEIFGCNWYCSRHFLYWRFFPIADQTPTPTRFLKNCEEVGLFNELASPFDHDFKKATEDDIKKVVLVVTLRVIISYNFLPWLAILSLICFTEMIYPYFSLVTIGFIPSCNAYHTQQNWGTYTSGGTSKQPSASPGIYYEWWQGKAFEWAASDICANNRE